MAVADFSRINSNIGALNALNSLNNVNRSLGMHQLRLATGKRINSAADDPAGLTIATKFRSRNENIKTAMDNIGDAQNLLSVAEGGLNKIQDILVDMRKKAESAASDTLGATERNAIESQLAEFAKEIDDIVEQTTWNGNKLLDGLTMFDSNQINFQTGAGTGTTDTTRLTAPAFGNVGVNGGALSNLATVTGSSTADIADLNSNGAADDVTAGGTGVNVDGSQFTIAGGEATTSGLSELASGRYQVRLVIGTDNNANGGTVQLLDSNGNAMAIDNGAGVQALSRTFSTLDAGGAVTLDFGNGLEVAFDSNIFTATGTASFSVDYTKTGNYSVSLDTNAQAVAYMNHVDTGISAVSDRLQTLGAMSSRLSFKEENLASAQVNTEAAYNRIMNADMARTQLEATKNQILQQTATSMLAQANQAPQGLLQLFR